LAAGCGSDLGECPDNSTPQQLAGRKIVQQRCQICHSSQLSGNARQGAPGNANFDDLGTTRDKADDMYSQTESGNMPPAPYNHVSGQDLENMRVWLACGAPDVATTN
jgi:mono/diheme cytochrome c family protein